MRTALDSGLRAIALTDHDTVEGIDEFLACGRESNLEVITGLEISATHREFSLHILGYGVNHTDPGLAEWLNQLQEGRTSRNKQIISKLRNMGHNIQLEELQSLSQHGQTGRPHIAQLLKNRGIVPSVNDAFSLYLRKGGPAWADRFAYTAVESIDMIHRAGGLAVLAHPGMLAQQTRAFPLVLAELVERGLDGIEAYYPAHSPAMEKSLRSFARKYQLVVTGGSDYHGKHRSFSTMAGKDKGFCPPETLLEPFRERLRTRQHVNVQ
ncbi:MAG: PHP domain-containing protein [Desulfobulbaceae bacterium]|nr:PHP domain-containing protein [Desulfobulbaceae bacterium]